MTTTTTTHLYVTYCDDDHAYVGADGDWQEGEEHSPRSCAAAQVDLWDEDEDLDDPGRDEAIIELATHYHSVDLDDLAIMPDDDFSALVCQWHTARPNGWTTAEADAMVRSEIRRRNAC